ncbi:MAG: prepilin-type N-terminal cleavage/methylation domain-containing protein [Verrucomicrobiae bacterium]|nr:prepilin-type N-terminal cleavage/methylation domain-containing protein [Verrucomicrobiae bacterium]
MKDFPVQRNEQGFTISELIVAAAVFVLVSALAMGGFVAVHKLYSFTRMLDTAHDDVRSATDTVSYYAKQSLAYPLLYASNGAVMSSGSSGEDLRLISSGFYGLLVSAVNIGDTTCTISNTALTSPIAILPTVYGTLPSNTAFATMTNSGVVRTSISVHTVGTNDVVRFDSTPAVYSMVSSNAGQINTLNAALTNTAVTTVSIPLRSAATTFVPSGTRVLIGREMRFLVTNAFYTNYAGGITTNRDMRMYTDSGNTSNYKTILSFIPSNTLTADVSAQDTTAYYVNGVSNAVQTPTTAQVPHTNVFTVIGPLLIVDLKYASPGDVTGKGIYRLRTQVTLRGDPQFKKPANSDVVGINAYDAGGVND